MCGIAGFLRTARAGSRNEMELTVSLMRDRLHHRGPDDAGAWVDEQRGIALGHRRLSIVDLSPAGHQPMHSVCGRYVLAFNGEIYNFQDLRKELESLGNVFRGHSDTEIVLAAVAQWGMGSALKRFTGMFAIAMWDRNERVLTLARDRMGEKPLYYGWRDHSLLFGSELKALCAYPGWQSEIDRDALGAYFRYGYFPAPRTVYRNIFKLKPGTYLRIATNTAEPGQLPEPQEFWSAHRAFSDGIEKPFVGTEQQAINELERLLTQSVAQQMVADVPLGAFLSGGIDSSIIVALMQSQSARPVKTFSIGFEEAEYNEAQHAKAVARHLGTEHTELYVTPKDALAVIPKLPTIWDEPFADSSQIPTYLLSKMTRQHVTVSLSGDGGDELFGGYPRYFAAINLWRKWRLVPKWLANSSAIAIGCLPATTWEGLLGNVFPLALGAEWKGRTGDRLYKMRALLKHHDPLSLYTGLVTCSDFRVLGASCYETQMDEGARILQGKPRSLLSVMTYLDSIAYLPDDILAKVDRAAMAASLEGRIPMLDHRVVEFAATVPDTLKMRNGQGKWLLRQVLYRHVPSALIDRPKMGFGVPIERWLGNELRDWVEDLISEQRLKRDGFLDPALVRGKWSEHLSGRRRWHYHLWPVLMFQAWLDSQKVGI